MNTFYTFDDVLIKPKFSHIHSRANVNLYQYILGMGLHLPIISANMDTITEIDMCKAMDSNGGLGCLHRFSSIEENLNQLKKIQPFTSNYAVSIGLGENELVRAKKLNDAGAKLFFIDVAHGASWGVVEQVKYLREFLTQDVKIIVGNFATYDSVYNFLNSLDHYNIKIDGIKVGIGPGSVCTTRVKTGVGVPQLSAIMEIAQGLKHTELVIIADGGMKTTGDIAKALGAGAHLVMLGKILAGTSETPGETIWSEGEKSGPMKIYRGSASKESYLDQGKNQTYITPEGESILIPHKGPVKDILNDIAGGLRSSLSYVGAYNLSDFREKCEFIHISPASQIENIAHGKLT